MRHPLLWGGSTNIGSWGKVQTSPYGFDPLTPTTSKPWGPLLAPADENAGCSPLSPKRARDANSNHLPLSPKGARAVNPKYRPLFQLLTPDSWLLTPDSFSQRGEGCQVERPVIPHLSAFQCH